MLCSKMQLRKLTRKGRLVVIFLFLAFSPILPTEHLSRALLDESYEPIGESIFKKDGLSIFGIKGVVLSPYSLIPSVPWWFQEELSIFPEDDDAFSGVYLDGTIFVNLHEVDSNKFFKNHKRLQSVLERQIADPLLAKCLSNQVRYGELAYRLNRERVILDLIAPSPVPAIWLLRLIKIRHHTNQMSNEYRRYNIMYSKSCQGASSYLRYPFFEYNGKKEAARKR